MKKTKKKIDCQENSNGNSIINNHLDEIKSGNLCQENPYFKSVNTNDDTVIAGSKQI